MLAVGIWAFVALVVGVIYPALLQALKVTPAQSTLEAPYIQRNITATRAAYALNNVQVQHVRRPPRRVTASQVGADAPTPSNNIRLWDPDPSISLQTFQRQQGITSYYTFPRSASTATRSAASSRRSWSGCARSRPANLPSSSWVNTHLQYTHGNGAVVALANQTQSNGNPIYGDQQRPADVVAGAAQDHPARASTSASATPATWWRTPSSPRSTTSSANSTNVESHYTGTGGVQLTSFLTPGRLRPPPRRLQPADLDQITDEVADHVRARPGADGTEGGAVPQLRPRPLRR